MTTGEQREQKGLTKNQLKDYLRRKLEQQDQRSDLWKELYDKEDLSLVTEIHPPMVISKIRLKLMRAAIDPKRTKPLIQVYDESQDKVMVSYKRQGRLEGLGALQALEAAAAEEERPPARL